MHNEKYKLKYLKYKLAYLYDNNLLNVYVYNKIIENMNNDDYRAKYKKYKTKYFEMHGGKGKGMGKKKKSGGGGGLFGEGEVCGIDEIGWIDTILGFIFFFGPIYYTYSKLFDSKMLSSLFKKKK